MTCHGKTPGKLEDCPDCKVLGSCVSKWNKLNPDKPKCYVRNIKKQELKNDYSNRYSYV